MFSHIFVQYEIYYTEILSILKQFAEQTSFIQFKGDTQRNNQLRYLYKNILIYSFLYNIFTAKLQFNKTAKKSNLFSDHCLKHKNKTKDLIQTYVKTQSYSSSFPSHRRAAVDYFQVCTVSILSTSEIVCLSMICVSTARIGGFC